MHTVCLDVKLSLATEVADAIEKGIKSTLDQLAIETASAGGSCEATLAVTVTGGALGAKYGPSRYCYPGVRLNGTVTLEGGGREPVRSTIDLEIDTPFAITSCPTAQTTLCGSTARQVFHRIVNLWDSSVMTPKATASRWSALDPNWGLHPSPIVGGRTNTVAYLTWCTFPSTASPDSG